MNKKDFLIEIFAEEIPAAFAKIYKDFVSLYAANFLKERKLMIPYNIYFTPNRMIIYIENVPIQRESIKREVWGPPADIAIKEGRKTKAYEAFLKKWNLKEDIVQIKEKGNKKFLYAIAKEEYPLFIDETVLLIEEIIKKHRFPKSMKWNMDKITYARPIRNILMIHGDNVKEGNILGIPVSKETYKDFTQRDKIRIKNVQEYFDFLRSEGILYKEEERLNNIKESMEKLLEENEYVYEDNDLLEEVLYMNEKVFAVKGTISKEFMDLPDKVIIISMRAHQRYFSIMKNNKLQPYFTAILHNTNANEGKVIKGLERVLKARLEDAKFYYEEDIKIGIDNMAEKLKGRNYLPKIGTLYDRIERIKYLAEYLNDKMEFNISSKDIDDISRLLKADLESEMVQGGKEFTKLEGYMGKIYALKAGYGENVAIAIEEHYMPKSMKDAIPETDAGILFAIVDKLDLLVGLILSGFRVTGAKDPGGIRRNTYGLIRILAEKKVNIDIIDILKISLDTFCKKGYCDGKEDVLVTLSDIVKGRLENYFLDKGYSKGIIRSVLAIGNANPYDIYLRLETLKKYEGTQEMITIAGGLKRVNNLLKKYSIEGKPEKSLFQDKEEKNIFDYIDKSIENAREFAHKGQYNSLMKLLMDTREYIDALFDNVLIMAKEEKIRDNRLKLLLFIKNFFELMCDMSLIQTK